VRAHGYMLATLRTRDFPPNVEERVLMCLALVIVIFKTRIKQFKISSV
jgi:hypothetical protein